MGFFSRLFSSDPQPVSEAELAELDSAIPGALSFASFTPEVVGQSVYDKTVRKLLKDQSKILACLRSDETLMGLAPSPKDMGGGNGSGRWALMTDQRLRKEASNDAISWPDLASVELFSMRDGTSLLQMKTHKSVEYTWAKEHPENSEAYFTYIGGILRFHIEDPDVARQFGSMIRAWANI